MTPSPLTSLQHHVDRWELLETEVMDSAVLLHHAIVRDCARKHGVYESATEGVGAGARCRDRQQGRQS